MPSPQTFQLRIMRETLETLVSRAIGTKSSPEKLMPPSIICSPTINSGTLPFPTANQDRNRGRWNTNHYSNLCPICKHHTTPKRAINIIESHFPSRSDSPIERKKEKKKNKYTHKQKYGAQPCTLRTEAHKPHGRKTLGKRVSNPNADPRMESNQTQSLWVRNTKSWRSPPYKEQTNRKPPDPTHQEEPRETIGEGRERQHKKWIKKTRENPNPSRQQFWLSLRERDWNLPTTN